MSKILKPLSILIIFLFLLSMFGWLVKNVEKGNKKFDFIAKPIKFMYSFPDKFKQSVKEVNTLPGTFIPTYAHFKPINKLKKDLIVLTSHSENDNSRTIVLLNLKNDSIIKKWRIDNPLDEVARIVNPIYQADGSLIYNYYYKAKPGLFKIDASGKVLWKNDSLIVHHGMNLNKAGEIWACTAIPGWKATGIYTLNDKKIFYNDYRITKFDNQTGKILFDKSITEILKENHIANYLFKSTKTIEPIHLNDVQPALKTTKYYHEDDVFISLRNMSIILQYRPATNELIRVIEGPFVNQHDVDFLNDSTLVMFNNNTYVYIKAESKPPHEDTTRYVNAGNFYSNIVSYSLANDRFTFIGDSIFRANKIYTENEGLVEFIDPNTYFVEEQNSGLLWVIQNNQVIYKNVFKSQHPGYHHLPNWTRIIKYE